ncbi:MAG TPA: hypothetical protein VGO47_09100 [Chlamydiales bacterium]|nr:hypothetical protein [Chlamydiales bacterium]
MSEPALTTTGENPGATTVANNGTAAAGAPPHEQPWGRCKFSQRPHYAYLADRFPFSLFCVCFFAVLIAGGTDWYVDTKNTYT